MKRLLYIRFLDNIENSLLKKYIEVLDNNDIKYVFFNDGEYSNNKYLIKLYIDRSSKNWNNIYEIINSVKAQKYNFINNNYIKNNLLYEII